MEDLKHNKKCTKCKEDFVYFQKDTWWDYTGINNVKLVKCPFCESIQSLKYGKLSNPNYDEKYYQYKK